MLVKNEGAVKHFLLSVRSSFHEPRILIMMLNLRLAVTILGKVVASARLVPFWSASTMLMQKDLNNRIITDDAVQIPGDGRLRFEVLQPC